MDMPASTNKTAASTDDAAVSSNNTAVASVLPGSRSDVRSARARARRGMRRERLLARMGQLRPLATAAYPSFVYRTRPTPRGAVPVFVEHQLDTRAFEECLSFLSNGGYRTITCDERLSRVNEKSATTMEIVLTFDDGFKWIYESAFPLCKKYDQRIVCFVCPGLIDDHCEGARVATSDLCTWDELSEMAASGLVDVQCHGLRHARVWTDPAVIGFLTDESDWVVCNERMIPARRRRGDTHADRPTPISVGTPIHRHKPAFQAPRRFDDPACGERIMSIARQYGTDFLNDPAFYRSVARRQAVRNTGRWITGAERSSEMFDALVKARRTLETRLSAASGRHLAWPWWNGCAMARDAARRVGFESVFCGPSAFTRKQARLANRMEVPRLSLDWHERLPGPSRVALWEIALRKLRGH